MGKWLAGIIAVVIGSLIVWWLTTSPNSPFYQKPIHSIKIIGFEIQPNPVTSGSNAVAIITILNDGNATAENCTVTWDFPKESLYADQVRLFEYSSSFGLSAGQTKQFRLTHLFGKKGTYITEANVACEKGGTHKRYQKTIEVR